MTQHQWTFTGLRTRECRGKKWLSGWLTQRRWMLSGFYFTSPLSLVHSCYHPVLVLVHCREGLSACLSWCLRISVLEGIVRERVTARCVPYLSQVSAWWPGVRWEYSALCPSSDWTRQSSVWCGEKRKKERSRKKQTKNTMSEYGHILSETTKQSLKERSVPPSSSPFFYLLWNQT